MCCGLSVLPGTGDININKKYSAPKEFSLAKETGT